MRPVKRQEHTAKYVGEHIDEESGEVVNKGVGDLPYIRHEGVVFSHWQPDEEERQIIAQGGQVVLGIHQEPIPPVSVGAVPAGEGDEPAWPEEEPDTPENGRVI